MIKIKKEIFWYLSPAWGHCSASALVVKVTQINNSYYWLGTQAELTELLKYFD